MPTSNMADQTLNEQESTRGGDLGPEAPASETDELRRERDALQDRLLRTAAEFDNYRKRIERERRDLFESASADALSEVLPVIDNLERALQVASGPDEGLRKGVELIHKQMLDLL